MSGGEKLVDLLRRYPKPIVGAAAFGIILLIFQDWVMATVFGAAVAFQTKRDWVTSILSQPSSYLDRSGTADDEIVRPAASRLIAPDVLELEDRRDEDWVAPPEPSAPMVAEMQREASDVRYGIAVPPRKPVDVPRR